MGDIADDHLAQMEEGGRYFPYHRTSYGPRVICKYCNGRVFWKREQGNYVLYDRATNEMHKCRANQPNTPDGFKDEPV